MLALLIVTCQSQDETPTSPAESTLSDTPPVAAVNPIPDDVSEDVADPALVDTSVPVVEVEVETDNSTSTSGEINAVEIPVEAPEVDDVIPIVDETPVNSTSGNLQIIVIM